jgi:DNA ligase-1
MVDWRGLACAFAILIAVPPTAFAADAVAPPLLLAERYRGGIDVPDYWISEKLDGVRAFWNGRELRFRSGNLVPAPQWFLDGLPSEALDGELWLARGRFDELSAIVRRQRPVDAEWRRVRYMIFELPGAAGTFSERLERMQVIIAAARRTWLTAVPQFRLPDERSLKKKLDEIVRAGGEGLMLHRADAAYETGRSVALLKYTPWLDAEAIVVGHIPGKGKHAGRLGALRMQLTDGRQFSLGSGLADSLRREPPPLGALVTYRYRELTSGGLPRFPRFLRVRDNP